jgi:putative spermidine/putrescine transport system substrate-binding protein
LVAALVLVAALLSVVATASGTVAVHHGKRANQIIIAGYGGLTPGFMRTYILDPFTKDTGIEVTWLTVPGQQVAGITAQNTAGNIQWDMTLKLSDSDMATLWKAGYLATAPARLQAKVKKIVPAAQPFAIPSQNGAAMIVCNYKLVKKCPKTPKQFFDTTNYPGPRMFASFQPLVAIGLALQASGMKPKDVFPASAKKSAANVAKAAQLLNQIKPSVKTFYSNSNQALQLLTSGEVTIAALWNAAAARAYLQPSTNMTIGASWIGAVKYAQYDVVYKGAPNEANAWKLIEWMYDHPKNLAQYAEKDNAGIADARAFKLLPAKVRQWLPAYENRPQSVDSDVIWYVQNPAIKQAIDDFWKGYTSG